MILTDDAKKQAATIVVGISKEPSSNGEMSEMKVEAAQAVIDAIKEEKAEELVQAMSALMMLCEDSDDY